MSFEVPSCPDRRGDPRTAVDLAGRIWHGPQAARLADCTLRDLSDGGACVELDEDVELPPRIFFAHRDAPAIFLAVVAWRRERAAGLSFAGGYPFGDCQRAPLDRLASEWRAALS